MLHTFLEPELQKLGVETQTVWFQQDGATAHTVRNGMRVLKDMFPARVISRRGTVEWPARSPDINACDFFLWGYLKSKVYENKPRTTMYLKQHQGRSGNNFSHHAAMSDAERPETLAGMC
jgi:hypothetical protein